MLKVIIEVHPHGNAEKGYGIHELFIANMGPIEGAECCSKEICNYHVWKKDPRDEIRRPKPNAKTIHDRSDGALILVASAILDLLGYDYSMHKRRPKKRKKK